jgi:hypothetical protein
VPAILTPDPVSTASVFAAGPEDRVTNPARDFRFSISCHSTALRWAHWWICREHQPKVLASGGRFLRCSATISGFVSQPAGQRLCGFQFFL